MAADADRHAYRTRARALSRGGSVSVTQAC